ncbi:sigma-E processing peptidase SpoIIGA [Natranaerobius thermophilus]|uniref:Peptidase U4 sporulation factor SpoIIGA n=1 Tax=Natranaerobius thermophilus (strain ATCC BAA-1301 / DSM 18059 / JW/NM-WN-LF) TaxID=457570 RepID=B2A2H7_NATTJ|nr:sigma-E processing peptidase SpoIIGA [Natranaerobius thermophilus]ACB84892.1 peptidase U4 sporulation factor SpoIIGA [Natranaerobius thermophilus JW/NM-WN-LF]
MYVIGEVVLVINLLLNFMLLFVTGRIMNLYCSLKKLLASGLIGTLAVFVPQFPGEILVKLAISVLMIRIAFGALKKQAFLVTLMVFYGVSFVMGGSIMGTAFLFSGQSNFQILMPGNLPFGYLVLAFIVALAVILGIRAIERKITLKKVSIPVKVVVNGKSVKLNALVDTGNKLKTFTGEYCLVVEARALDNVLTSDEKHVLSEISNYNQLDDRQWDQEASARFFPLWFNSLGTEHGLLLAFRPEKLALGNSGTSFECNGTVNKNNNGDPWREVSALIAVTFQELNIDDTNCGLVPVELLKFAEGS